MKSFEFKRYLSRALPVFISCLLILPACSSKTKTDQPSSSGETPSSTGTAPSVPVSQRQGADPLTAGSGTDRPGASPLELMQNTQVSQELKLTPDQLAQIDQTNQKFRKTIEQATAGVNWASLKGNEAKQKEIQDRMNAEIQTARDEITQILTPEQLTRFKEISLQVYGFGILSYDQFTQELALTTEQQTNLDTLRQDTAEKIRANLEPPQDNSPDALERAKESNKTRAEQILKESNQQAVNVLTAEQKSQLETLKGQPFNLDTSQQPSVN